MTEPWLIPPSLPHSPPQVILVLGEPSNGDLLPLLSSPHLSRSLVLIATHLPPRLPALPASSSGPAVRILRLPSQISAHDNVALRLVNLFERAQRVARLWRYTSFYPSTSALAQIQNRVMQLAEESSGGDFTLVEPVIYASPNPDKGGRSPSQRGGSSPAPSFTSRTPSGSKLRPLSSTSSTRPQVEYLPTQSKLFKQALNDMLDGVLTLPPNTSSSTDFDTLAETRTFDAILNFLPAGVPEKILLKHAILVSTLCAQYLAPPVTAAHPAQLTVPTSSTSNATSKGRQFQHSKRPSTQDSYLRNHTTSTGKAISPFPPVAGANTKPNDYKRFSTMSSASTTSVPQFPTSTPRMTGGRRSSFSGWKGRLSSIFGGSSSTPDIQVLTPGHQNGYGTPAHEPPANRSASTLRRGSMRNININTRSRTKNAHLVHVLPNQVQTANNIEGVPPVISGRAPILNQNGASVKNYHMPTARSPYALDSNPTASNTIGRPVEMGHSRTTSNISGISGMSASSFLTVAPGGKPKFVQNLEQFLTNFGTGFPAPSAQFSNTSLTTEFMDANKPIPYVVSSAMFGRRIPGTKGAFLSISLSPNPTENPHQLRELTVGEIILLGALDVEVATVTFNSEKASGLGRCWVGSIDDFTVAGAVPRTSVVQNSLESSLPPRLFIAGPERTTRTPPLPSPLIKISEEGINVRADSVEIEDFGRIVNRREERAKEEAERPREVEVFQELEKHQDNVPSRRFTEEKTASQTLPTPPESSSSGEEQDDRDQRGRNWKRLSLSRAKTRSKSRASSKSRAGVSTPPYASTTFDPLATPVPPITAVPTSLPNENGTTTTKQPHYVKRSSSAISMDTSAPPKRRNTLSRKSKTFGHETSPEIKPLPSVPVPPLVHLDANALWNEPDSRINPIRQAKIIGGPTESVVSPQILQAVPEGSVYANGLRQQPSMKKVEVGQVVVGLGSPLGIVRTSSPSSTLTATTTKPRPGMMRVDSSGTLSVSGSIRASSPLARSKPFSVPVQANMMTPTAPNDFAIPSGLDWQYDSNLRYPKSPSITEVTRNLGVPRPRQQSGDIHVPVPAKTSNMSRSTSNGPRIYDFSLPREPWQDAQSFTAVDIDRDRASHMDDEHQRESSHREERRGGGFTGTLRKFGLWKKEKPSSAITGIAI